MKSLSSINRKQLLNFILLIPFFKPIGPTYYHGVNLFYQIYKLVSLALIILYLLAYIGRGLRIKNLTGLIGLVVFYLIYVLNCFRFGTSGSDIINNGITNIFLFLYIFIHLYKKQKERIIYPLAALFRVLLAFQVLSMAFIYSTKTVLFEPLNGDFIYFLGTDNYSAFSVIPMIGIVLFADYVKRGKVSHFDLVLLFSIMLVYLYVRSISAMLAMCFFILVFLVSKKHLQILRSITVQRMLLFSVVFVFLIVFFHIQDFFAALLSSKFMGKGERGITLNSRTYIWAGAVRLIRQKLLLGHGVLSDRAIKSFTLYGAAHAHNLALEVLLRTGIIGSAGYVWFIIYPIRKSRILIKRKELRMLFFTLIAFLALSVLDTYPNTQPQYCLMSLIYGIPFLKKECDNKSLAYC